MRVPKRKSYLYCFVLFFEIESWTGIYYIGQADLELAKVPLHWSLAIWEYSINNAGDQTQSFVHAKQALYQWNYISQTEKKNTLKENSILSFIIEIVSHFYVDYRIHKVKPVLE